MKKSATFFFLSFSEVRECIQDWLVEGLYGTLTFQGNFSLRKLLISKLPNAGLGDIEWLVTMIMTYFPVISLYVSITFVYIVHGTVKAELASNMS